MNEDGGREWPPQFDRWPLDGQIAYLKLRYKRPELIEVIGDLADIRSIQERDIDPSNARFGKDELAELALHLGIYRRDVSGEEDRWF